VGPGPGAGHTVAFRARVTASPRAGLYPFKIGVSDRIPARLGTISADGALLQCQIECQSQEISGDILSGKIGNSLILRATLAGSNPSLSAMDKAAVPSGPRRIGRSRVSQALIPGPAAEW